MNPNASIAGWSPGRGLAGALGHLGTPFVEAETLATMSQHHSWGRDRVLNLDRSFGIVFMNPDPGLDFGSYRAFGHDGAARKPPQPHGLATRFAADADSPTDPPGRRPSQ